MDEPQAFTPLRLVDTVRFAASFVGVKSSNRQVGVNRTRRFFGVSCCSLLLAS